MSWPMVALGSLVELINGDRGKNYPSKEDFRSQGIPFINAGCLDDDHNIDQKQINFISQEKYDALNSGKIIINDILFCLRGSIGKYAVVQNLDVGAIASSLVIIRCKKNIDVNYLKNYLQSELCKREINNYENGAAQPNLSASDLKKIKLPLPPLEEQKRIAAILDKADAIRQKRQKAIELADEFLRSVFLDMFGDPVTNPKGWETYPIGQISQIVTGNTPPRSEKENYGSHIEWIKSDNINTPNHYLTKADEYLSIKGAGKGRCVSEGAILITCIAGSPHCIGNVAITNRTVAFNQQINAIIPSNMITTQYIYSSILFGKKLIQSISTNSMKGMVSKGNLEKLCIPVPPIELQHGFSSIFKSCEERIIKTYNSKFYMDEIFLSIQKKLF